VRHLRSTQAEPCIPPESSVLISDCVFWMNLSRLICLLHGLVEELVDQILELLSTDSVDYEYDNSDKNEDCYHDKKYSAVLFDKLFHLSSFPPH